jgi:hypothetical protein
MTYAAMTDLLSACQPPFPGLDRATKDLEGCSKHAGYTEGQARRMVRYAALYE